jgi:hypothetical protein
VASLSLSFFPPLIGSETDLQREIFVDWLQEKTNASKMGSGCLLNVVRQQPTICVLGVCITEFSSKGGLLNVSLCWEKLNTAELPVLQRIKSKLSQGHCLPL